MSWAEVKNLKDKMSDIANSRLHIEGGTDLAGQEVIIKRYDSDYMKATLDSTGSLEVEVTPKSKYRVTSNDADLSKRSQDIEVGTGDLVNVELSYRKYSGKDVLPVDDVPTWLACHPTAGSYKYTTIAQVIADTACLTQLLSNQNSLDYLMRSKSLFGAIVENAGAASTFSSIPLANTALCNTPALCVIASNNLENCVRIFPWQLGRTVSSGANDLDTADGLLASHTGNLPNNFSFSCFAHAANVAKLSGALCAFTGDPAVVSLSLKAGTSYKYKFVPKCLIINASNVHWALSNITVSFSGKRYDNGEWETIGAVQDNNFSVDSGLRFFTDVAENNTEYVEFKITVPRTHPNDNVSAIGNIHMLGYRYAYKDGREEA